MNVDEQPLVVEARAGPLLVRVIAGRDVAVDAAVGVERGVGLGDIRRRQVDHVLSEHESPAVLREAAQPERIAAAVLAQEDAAARADCYVVGIVALGVAQARAH